MSSVFTQRMVLFLGHGSRAPGAMQGMEMVYQQIKDHFQVPNIMMCQMEGLGLNLKDAIEQSYQQGFREILVQPFFLHAGNHLLIDVPEILDHAREQFPDLRIHQGRHLGSDPALAELAYRRLQQSMGDMG